MCSDFRYNPTYRISVIFYFQVKHRGQKLSENGATNPIRRWNKRRPLRKSETQASIHSCKDFKVSKSRTTSSVCAVMTTTGSLTSGSEEELSAVDDFMLPLFMRELDPRRRAQGMSGLKAVQRASSLIQQGESQCGTADSQDETCNMKWQLVVQTLLSGLFYLQQPRSFVA